MIADSELTKTELRKNILRARKQLSDEARALASENIALRVLQNEAYQNAEYVFAYAAMKYEVQTMNLLEKMLADGKKVYLPVITGKHEMKAVRVFALQDLVEGEYGILTVKNKEQEYLEPKKLDCILVPGVAFDRQGNRLGMGGGYYDNLLPFADKAVKLALAYAVQVVGKVPTEAHDCSVDYIITENEYIVCGNDK